jgi:hypothetical protein
MVKTFLLSTSSKPIVGPTHPPVHWVPRVLSTGVKRPGHEADHSPLSSAEIKNDGVIPPLLHMSSWHSDNFTFTFRQLHRYFPNMAMTVPFQFLPNSSSSYHTALYCLVTDSFIKWPTTENICDMRRKISPFHFSGFFWWSRCARHCHSRSGTTNNPREKFTAS